METYIVWKIITEIKFGDFVIDAGNVYEIFENHEAEIKFKCLIIHLTKKYQS